VFNNKAKEEAWATRRTNLGLPTSASKKEVKAAEESKLFHMWDDVDQWGDGKKSTEAGEELGRGAAGSAHKAIIKGTVRGKTPDKDYTLSSKDDTQVIKKPLARGRPTRTFEVSPGTHEIEYLRKISEQIEEPTHQRTGVNILKVHEATSTGIVMDRMDGGEFYDYFPGQPREQLLEKEKANLLFYDIANFIAMCHDIGLVHNDIKPENVLLNTELDKAYVIDMGLMTDSKGLERPSTTMKSRSQSKVPNMYFPAYGSRAYWPRNWVIHQVGKVAGWTHHHDWYALGIMLFEYYMPDANQQISRITFNLQDRGTFITQLRDEMTKYTADGDTDKLSLCDLITTLLAGPEVTHPLLAPKSGAEVLNHPWFSTAKESRDSEKRQRDTDKEREDTIEDKGNVTKLKQLQGMLKAGVLDRDEYSKNLTLLAASAGGVGAHESNVTGKGKIDIDTEEQL
jgi:serine/threonine protein kinase